MPSPSDRVSHSASFPLSTSNPSSINSKVKEPIFRRSKSRRLSSFVPIFWTSPLGSVPSFDSRSILLSPLPSGPPWSREVRRFFEEGSQSQEQDPPPRESQTGGTSSREGGRRQPEERKSRFSNRSIQIQLSNHVGMETRFILREERRG